MRTPRHVLYEFIGLRQARGRLQLAPQTEVIEDRSVDLVLTLT